MDQKYFDGILDGYPDTVSDKEVEQELQLYLCNELSQNPVSSENVSQHET